MDEKNLNWYNNNSLRSYPLKERYKINGIDLPTDVFVDMIYYASEYNTYISSIKYDGNLYISFSEDSIATIDVSNYILYTPVPILFKNKLPRGFIVFGNGINNLCKIISSGVQYDVIWNIDDSCILKVPGRVRSFIIDNVPYQSRDIKIRAGDGLHFTINGNDVRIDAYYDYSECAKTPCIPLKTINNISPDEKGNIQLEAKGILNIGTSENGLTVSTALSQDRLCLTRFEDGLKGDNGDPGPQGPQGSRGSCAYGFIGTCPHCNNMENYECICPSDAPACGKYTSVVNYRIPIELLIQGNTFIFSGSVISTSIDELRKKNYFFFLVNQNKEIGIVISPGTYNFNSLARTTNLAQIIFDGMWLTTRETWIKLEDELPEILSDFLTYDKPANSLSNFGYSLGKLADGTLRTKTFEVYPFAPGGSPSTLAIKENIIRLDNNEQVAAVRLLAKNSSSSPYYVGLNRLKYLDIEYELRVYTGYDSNTKMFSNLVKTYTNEAMFISKEETFIPKMLCLKQAQWGITNKADLYPPNVDYYNGGFISSPGSTYYFQLIEKNATESDIRNATGGGADDLRDNVNNDFYTMVGVGDEVVVYNPDRTCTIKQVYGSDRIIFYEIGTPITSASTYKIKFKPRASSCNISSGSWNNSSCGWQMTINNYRSGTIVTPSIPFPTLPDLNKYYYRDIFGHPSSDIPSFWNGFCSNLLFDARNQVSGVDTVLNGLDEEGEYLWCSPDSGGIEIPGWGIKAIGLYTSSITPVMGQNKNGTISISLSASNWKQYNAGAWITPKPNLPWQFAFGSNEPTEVGNDHIPFMISGGYAYPNPYPYPYYIDYMLQKRTYNTGPDFEIKNLLYGIWGNPEYPLEYIGYPQDFPCQPSFSYLDYFNVWVEDPDPNYIGHWEWEDIDELDRPYNRDVYYSRPTTLYCRKGSMMRTVSLLSPLTSYPYSMEPGYNSGQPTGIHLI